MVGEVSLERVGSLRGVWCPVRLGLAAEREFPQGAPDGGPGSGLYLSGLVWNQGVWCPGAVKGAGGSPERPVEHGGDRLARVGFCSGERELWILRRSGLRRCFRVGARRASSGLLPWGGLRPVFR